MNFRNLFLIAIAFSGIISFTSCKKEHGKTKTELLTSGPWRLVHEIVYDGRDSLDYVKLDPPCQQDNTITFRPDSLLVRDRGALLCDVNEQQVNFSEWRFEENETKIKIDAIIWDIEALTTTELRLFWKFGTGQSKTQFYIH